MLSEQIKIDLAKEAEEISKNLQLSLDEDLPVLKESYFRNNFADYFVGNKDINEKIELLHVWKNKICGGNSLLSVKILDDHTGKVLFLVPPILETNIINPSKKRNVSFFEIVKLMELRKYVDPYTARGEFLSNSNEHFINSLEASEEFMKNKEKWDFIIKKYRKETIKENITTNTKQQQQQEDVGSWD